MDSRQNSPNPSSMALSHSSQRGEKQSSPETPSNTNAGNFSSSERIFPRASDPRTKRPRPPPPRTNRAVTLDENQKIGRTKTSTHKNRTGPKSPVRNFLALLENENTYGYLLPQPGKSFSSIVRRGSSFPFLSKGVNFIMKPLPCHLFISC